MGVPAEGFCAWATAIAVDNTANPVQARVCGNNFFTNDRFIADSLLYLRCCSPFCRSFCLEMVIHLDGFTWKPSSVGTPARGKSSAPNIQDADSLRLESL